MEAARLPPGEIQLRLNRTKPGSQESKAARAGHRWPTRRTFPARDWIGREADLGRIKPSGFRKEFGKAVSDGFDREMRLGSERSRTR